MTTHDHRAWDSPSGVSLLELIASIAIVGAGVMAYVGSQITATNTDARAELMSFAVVSAESKLEELTLLDVAQIRSGTDRVQLPTGEEFARKWAVQPDRPLPGLTTISVVVAAPGRESPDVELHTVRIDGS